VHTCGHVVTGAYMLTCGWYYECTLTEDADTQNIVLSRSQTL